MSPKGKLESSKPAQGRRIGGATATPPKVGDRPPTFAFHKMVKPDCDAKTKGKYFDHFMALSSLTWKQIRADNHEGFGLEPIPTKQFVSRVRRATPPDVPRLAVGRVSKRMRFAGYVVGDVFYVVVLDPNHVSY